MKIPRLQLRRAGVAAAFLMMPLFSCSDSGGPPAVRTGTPAYYFQNAKDAYGKGDYMKAIDWLDKITNANKNEFTDRAWTFKLLLQSGLITGYKELGENYEYGQRSNKENATPFIKKVTEYRSAASRMALPFGEAYAAYEKNGPPAEIVIDFPFPAVGTTTKPPALGKIAQGLVPNEESVDTALKGMLARGIVQAICQTVDAKDDAAKGRAALANLPVKVPRAAFELEMAHALYAGMQMHSRKLQGNPAVAEFLGQQAQKALSVVTDTSKDTKDLKANIEKDLKEAKARK